jgi:hypothetical protein
MPRQYGVGRIRSCKKRVVSGRRYSKELFKAVKELRLEKVQKFFNYPDLDEGNHDKVYYTARINVRQKAPGQPIDGEGGLNGTGDEPEEDADESNDEQASMVEIFLENTTDGPRINIVEIRNKAKYQRLRERNSATGRRSAEDYRAKLVCKLYKGGLYTLRKQQNSNWYWIEVLLIHLLTPSSIDVDHDRQATVKTELVHRGSRQLVYLR